MRNRRILNSPRFLKLKKKKRKILRIKIFISMFLFLLVLIGLSFLSQWKSINISSIQISGNKIIETKEIKNIVEKNINDYYFWVFPKTNFLFYPKEKIRNELTNKFKRIKNISFDIKNLNILNISITERKGLYTYCGLKINEVNNSQSEKLALKTTVSKNLISKSTASENSILKPIVLKNLVLKPLILENNKCYFMDDNGYIFSEAPYFSRGVYLKLYGTVNMKENNPIGFYFFQSYFNKIISLEKTLKEIEIKPVIFYIENDGDIKMFLSSTTPQLGPEIIFKMDSNFEKMVENLQTVLTTEPLESDFKNKYSSILYIDFRFGDKIYYKLK